MDKYHDIRPYKDNEVPAVMKRLVKNKLLISTVRMMKWPNCPDNWKNLADFAIRLSLTRKLKKIKTVDDFQQRIVADLLLKWVLSHTTDDLTWSGINNLTTDKSYIFISNHRDIVLDSAFLNYILDANGYKVPYIAFGDNLLINDFISDLIQVNRAFTVKRDLPPRMQFRALIHLSGYINHLLNKGNHFWIAQREGRAKDGIDSTNPAIIKMFYLSEKKKQPDFSVFIKSRNIIPVAVSYEKDPCDRLKAWELHRKNKRGEHKKRKNEDFVSMTMGITRNKGRVHIAFGKPLVGELADEKAVAQEIDAAIHRQYKLWPTNYIAYDEIYHTQKYSDKYNSEEKTSFIARYNNLNPAVRQILFKTYANPVSSSEAQKKNDGIIEEA